MATDDLVLFYTGAGEFRYCCSVAGKAESVELANLVWGTDAGGEPFKLLFSLSPPWDPMISLDRLIELLGYGPNYRVQNFYGLSENQSQTLIDAISLDRGSGGAPAPDALEDIETQAEDLATLGETEREIVIKSRIGQGRFRDDLIELWDGRCAVSGVEGTELLRASHIKPWRNCTNDERLDRFNGLLLLPHFDHLFDAGFISFDPSGMILISESLSNDARAAFQITEDIGLIRLYRQHRPYLEFHRDEVFH